MMGDGLDSGLVGRRQAERAQVSSWLLREGHETVKQRLKLLLPQRPTYTRRLDP